MTKIEQQDTADNSETPSFEIAVDEDDVAVEGVKDEMIPPAMASKRHRIALAAGIIGLFILVAGVSTVAALMGRSFKDKSSAETSEAFDFNDVADDVGASNVGGNSTAPQPTPGPTEPEITTTELPTSFPTGAPTNTTSSGPTNIPSDSPSNAPTPIASASPTAVPTVPSPAPTMTPNSLAPVTAVDYASSTLLTFCVIADVPYDNNEKQNLPGQIATQMEGCEFLVHLGDIMQGDIPCDDEHFIVAKDLMLESDIPTFIVVGDNEWNDCGSLSEIDVAYGKWTNYFMHLEDNWNHTIPVVRSLDYPESFYFVRKRTLIFGLNVVGGRVHDADEWLLRHTTQAEWVKEVVEMNVPLYADGVIIMAHAKPTESHMKFFNPMRRLVRDVLGNQIPVLYLHGDGHAWIVDNGFMNQPNFLRIQHAGGVRDPVLKVLADPAFLGPKVTSAFQFDRQLFFE